MRRFTLLLFVVIIASSCNQKGDKKQSSADSEKQLPGSWMMNSINHNGASAKCNVCPRVEFKNDHLATVMLPSGNKTELSWLITGDTLKLNYIKDTNNVDPFGRKAYLMEFKQTDKYTSLTLTQTDDQKQSYSLAKAK